MTERKLTYILGIKEKSEENTKHIKGYLQNHGRKISKLREIKNKA